MTDEIFGISVTECEQDQNKSIRNTSGSLVICIYLHLCSAGVTDTFSRFFLTHAVQVITSVICLNTHCLTTAIDIGKNTKQVEVTKLSTWY